jgi:hypothetical protein
LPQVSLCVRLDLFAKRGGHIVWNNTRMERQHRMCVVVLAAAVFVQVSRLQERLSTAEAGRSAAQEKLAATQTKVDAGMFVVGWNSHSFCPTH